MCIPTYLRNLVPYIPYLSEPRNPAGGLQTDRIKVTARDRSETVIRLCVLVRWSRSIKQPLDKSVK